MAMTVSEPTKTQSVRSIEKIADGECLGWVAALFRCWWVSVMAMKRIGDMMMCDV